MILMDTQTLTHRLYISITFRKRDEVVRPTLISPILKSGDGKRVMPLRCRGVECTVISASMEGGWCCPLVAP